MYFDLLYYRKVLAYTWKSKDWPGRIPTLLELLIVVPLVAIINTIFFYLDYLLFPSLWAVRIKKPVFIVGHARSGTTLTHRLMASDEERFSYFLYWELFFPSLTQKVIIRWLGVLDQRLLGGFILGRLKVWDKKIFDPYRHMHDMSLWNPEEDQFVMSGAFVTQKWQLNIPMMHEIDIFHIDELSPKRRKKWMNFYKACIKRQLVFNGGNKTHLSKNPVMSGWVSALLETFPDARIVVNVRDPIQCIPSTLKLVETVWQMNKWKKHQYGPALQALTEISFDTFSFPQKALLDKPDTPNFTVDYRHLVNEPSSTIQALYKALRMTMCDAHYKHLLEVESREKNHKTHFVYNIDDYEISPNEIESRLLSFYKKYDWPRLSDVSH
ncbi:MAG: sulfotransferase [Pseudomonadales bacterium]|nr:sulfotransferase [Pseudomonadales bacterium]